MKYIGSVLILCACICLSYFYEIKEKTKLENLKKIRDFINYIRVKIDFFLTPQKKLFYEYDWDTVKLLYDDDFKSINKYFDKDIL